MVVQTWSTIWEEGHPEHRFYPGFRSQVDTVVVGSPTGVARYQQLAIRKGRCYWARLGTLTRWREGWFVPRCRVPRVVDPCRRSVGVDD